MSITNDIKGYADAAVETGRSVINDGISQGRGAVNERLTALRTTLDEGIDGAGARAGSLAETVTGTGSQALDRVRLNAFAGVGAVDAAVTTLVTRLQEFPNDVAGTVAKAQNAATDAADKVQARVNAVVGKATDTVGSAEKTVDDVRSGALLNQARENAEAYRKQVAQTVAERRADLAARGEAVVTELRKDPRVVRVAKLVGAAAETVEDTAAKPARSRAAEKAQETRARNERSARAKKAAQTRARKSTGTTATKAAPRKTTRTTSPAKKATKATKASS